MQCHRVSFSVSIFVNYNNLPDEIQNMPAKQRICQKVDKDFLNQMWSSCIIQTLHLQLQLFHEN